MKTVHRYYIYLLMVLHYHQTVLSIEFASMLLFIRRTFTKIYDAYFYRYPSLSTVRLLLQCGADVNTSNILRDKPIHVFISNSNDCNESILQLLCDAGAHLDCANKLRQTPMDLASDFNTRELLKARIKRSLKCLCARFIQKNEIPFHGKIGHSLAHFVEQH